MSAALWLSAPEGGQATFGPKTDACVRGQVTYLAPCIDEYPKQEGCCRPACASGLAILKSNASVSPGDAPPQRAAPPVPRVAAGSGERQQRGPKRAQLLCASGTVGSLARADGCVRVGLVCVCHAAQTSGCIEEDLARLCRVQTNRSLVPANQADGLLWYFDAL